MNFLKIKKFCRVFRIIMGTLLIGYAFYNNNDWFYLGVIPLIAGITNFCPLCEITGKCTIPQAKK